MTRQSKTPRQRAQEQLDVEERRVTKLTKKRNDLATEQAGVQAELAQAIARRDHLKSHPDLSNNQARPTSTGDQH
jgi:cell division protein FtsB